MLLETLELDSRREERVCYMGGLVPPPPLKSYTITSPRPARRGRARTPPRTTSPHTGRSGGFIYKVKAVSSLIS